MLFVRAILIKITYFFIPKYEYAILTVRNFEALNKFFSDRKCLAFLKRKHKHEHTLTYIIYVK